MKELIKLFNKYNVLGDMEVYLDENSEVEELKGYNFKFIENLDTNEHRWYFVDTNVYQIFKDNNPIGYVGVIECGSLKSESMCIEDTGIETEFVEVKEITKKSFEIVSEEEE